MFLPLVATYGYEYIKPAFARRFPKGGKLVATSWTMARRHYCEAFDDFQRLTYEMLQRYTYLNPRDGKLFEHVKWKGKSRDKKNDLDERGMEFVRGGMVAIMSAWEGYVHDLFKEAFGLIIDIYSTPGTDQESSLSNLKSSPWRKCCTIIQEEVKHEAKTKHEGCMKRLVYDLLLQEDEGTDCEWRRMLDSYCDRLLHGKTLPKFSLPKIDGKNTMCIDELFQQLFLFQNEFEEEGSDSRNKKEKPKTRLSDIMIEVEEFSYDIRLPKIHKVTFKKSDCSAVQALCNISRLYHGIRCAFVHGKHQKAMEGPLAGFADNFTMPAENDERVKQYYINLYNRVKQYGRNAFVSYLTLVNLTRFYRTAAKSLKLALAKWVYDLPKSGKRECIWQYRPLGVHQGY